MEKTAIIDDWAFEADENCVTLLKKHTTKSGSKKGQEYYRPAGYYNNFGELLSALVDKDLQNLAKFEMVFARIDELKQNIKKHLCQSCRELILDGEKENLEG